MATATQGRKGTATTDRTQSVEAPRKGIFWDKHAGQWACRVGYRLDEKTGQRARDIVYRLGIDENDAIVRHAGRLQLWDATVARWPQLAVQIRPALPEAIRDTADLSKAVWIKDAWFDAATVAVRADIENLRASSRSTLATAATNHADRMVQMAEAVKDGMKVIADPAENWLDLIPAAIRAQVMNALAPSAHEIRGVAVDARRLTIRQAADEFLAHKKSKVGLKLQGRKSGGGICGNTYNHLKDVVNGALLLLDDKADLRTLNHQRLEQLVDDAYRKARSPRTAFAWCKGGLKPMLDWCHKRSDIDYRNVETIDEIFRLTKPDTAVKTSYTPDAIAKLKAIKVAAETMQAESWVFVLLALNTGAYQVDIASWTKDNIKFDDAGRPYLWWQRQKELHHNENLWSLHEIWPELWELMQATMAPDDPARNPQRRLFLTRGGDTLHETGLGRSRRDVIKMRYSRAMAKAVVVLPDGQTEPVRLAFKQLRKIGLNAVKKFSGGSDDVARRYAGQKVPGVLKAYLDDDYADVSVALAKWRDQLKADKVL